MQNKADFRQWQVLGVYNCLRIVCILLFILLAVYLKSRLEYSLLLYLSTLALYLIFAICFFHLHHQKRVAFKTQVLIGGVIDIVMLSLLINAFSKIGSSLGILLNVNVAMLSMMVPGRLAIFFAAIASTTLLGIHILEYIFLDSSTTDIFNSGVHGAGLFATALTAWYLAHRVQLTETIAQSRGRKLESIQQINEYIVERLHSGIIYINENSEIELINTAARMFFNKNKQDHLLLLPEISTELYDKMMFFSEQMGAGKKSWETMLEEPPLKANFLAVNCNPKTAILIFLEDLSLITQQAQQLKLASLGRLSASIAHELRNPLGAISHAVQLMGEGNSLNEDDSRLKQLIINNCNRMNQAIKNVLQMSRGEPSKPQSFDLKKFLEEFRNDFMASHPCSITLILTPGALIYFDKSQLEQILIILCDNSIKHGKEKSGQVNIVIQVIINAGHTEMIISDTGVGIPLSLKHEVFEPFFSTTRTGLGMGLYLARDLCEMNNARLTLSQAEKGAIFIITMNQTAGFHDE
ncbi:sensor histidine kinase [Legionella genomosp. 1]|uniref:sensor histidine kinase n=1 Tax=Legionella genomosp. 1 TaxID=1093625 RepID=UPI001055E3E8|nr:ATP-binding protein [Legionella genomosp. 1]